MRLEHSVPVSFVADFEEPLLLDFSFFFYDTVVFKLRHL